jgi:hypothetical protein
MLRLLSTRALVVVLVLVVLAALLGVDGDNIVWGT